MLPVLSESNALSIAGIRNRNFEDKHFSEVVVLQLSESLAGSPWGVGGFSKRCPVHKQSCSKCSMKVI